MSYVARTEKNADLKSVGAPMADATTGSGGVGEEG